MTSPHRVALVTGGSRGIGAAIAHRLGQDGLTVHLTHCRLQTRERADRVAAAIEAVGGRGVVHRCDVGDEDDVRRLVDEVLDRDGTVHVLVNNAAVTADALVMTTPVASWEQVLRVNLTGPWLLCRQVIPVMLDQGEGRIINVSSASVRTPGPGQSAYAASKGGLEALTRALAAEVGHKGIRVNTVAPGTIRTDMTAAVADRLDAPGERIRWGTPQDVAGVVAFLAGPEAEYVQGETLTVDGGRQATRPVVPPLRSGGRR